MRAPPCHAGCTVAQTCVVELINEGRRLNRAAAGSPYALDRVAARPEYFAMRHVVTRPDAPDPRPLSEPVLLILICLARTPRHGYAMIKDIEALSQGRVRLSTGTLYGALRRLLEDRWIERFAQDDTSREKQAYRLTAGGRRQLQAELARMKSVTRIAGARLRVREA